MCVVCQIAITGAAVIASVVPAMGSTETASSSAVSSESVSAHSDTPAFSPVSLRIDDMDVNAKGCASPGETVTATGSGFDVASNSPKVFIAFGLFANQHPAASQVIAVEGSVKSATSMSFVVPTASRFGKSSIAGSTLTVVWSSNSTYGMGPKIPFEVCAAGTTGGKSNSGKPSSSGKTSVTTIAKSLSGGISLVGKNCAPVGLNLNVNGVKITCKKSGGSSRWVQVGK